MADAGRVRPLPRSGHATQSFTMYGNAYRAIGAPTTRSRQLRPSPRAWCCSVPASPRSGVDCEARGLRVACAPFPRASHGSEEACAHERERGGFWGGCGDKVDGEGVSLRRRMEEPANHMAGSILLPTAGRKHALRECRRPRPTVWRRHRERRTWQSMAGRWRCRPSRCRRSHRAPGCRPACPTPRQRGPARTIVRYVAATCIYWLPVAYVSSDKSRSTTTGAREKYGFAKHAAAHPSQISATVSSRDSWIGDSRRTSQQAVQPAIAERSSPARRAPRRECSTRAKRRASTRPTGRSGCVCSQHRSRRP